jgi:hypothetical protein
MPRRDETGLLKARAGYFEKAPERIERHIQKLEFGTEVNRQVQFKADRNDQASNL